MEGIVVAFGIFTWHKKMNEDKKNISRSEIKKIIESHGKWYQNIRFGFMLETHHTSRSPARKAPAEYPSLAMKALARKTKEEVLTACSSGDFVVRVDISWKAIEQAKHVAEILRRLSRPIGKLNTD